MKFNFFKKKKQEVPVEEGNEGKKDKHEKVKSKEKTSEKEQEDRHEHKKTKHDVKFNLEKKLPKSKDLEKLKNLKKKNILSKKKKRNKISYSIRGFVKSIDLQKSLERAGMLTLNAKKIAKKLFKINIYLCIVLTVIFVILNIAFQKSFGNLVVFLLGFWITVFFILLALLWIVYLIYLDLKIFKRKQAIEAVFPDFLQLTSANISAGMPIDQALWYAVRPSFGVLAKEIEDVAKKTMAGEDLADALTDFATKYNSKIIQRSINLLLEGMAAGGEMADLLSKIALNIEETKILKKEMAANVTTYVIFISFATIGAAPILFGLATELLVIIQNITSSLGSTMGASSSFFSFSFSADSIKLADFKIFSYLMLTISAIASACIVAIIKKGRIKEGLSNIPVFIAVSLILYTFSTFVIHIAFGTFF